VSLRGDITASALFGVRDAIFGCSRSNDKRLMFGRYKRDSANEQWYGTLKRNSRNRWSSGGRGGANCPQPAFEACAALHEGGARLHLGARSAPLMYVTSKGHTIPRFVSRAYVGVLRVDVAAGESWREQKQKQNGGWGQAGVRLGSGWGTVGRLPALAASVE
jgi:hypothetical protein